MRTKSICQFMFGALILIQISTGCTGKTNSSPTTVRVLTYSSLGAKGGFLTSVADDFKTKSGCSLKVETTLGAAQILSYLEEPKARERVDLVMGMDELLFARAQSYLYTGINPAASANKPQYLDFIQARAQAGFYPTDYGAMSFIYRKADFQKLGLKVPEQLTDLLKPEYQKKFILQDPRASSPGMLFFIFSEGILKIKDLKKQWLTLAPSWDASYKMFLQKDSPMVWSYLSSLAYHATKNEADQYGYVDFKEGLPVQIEGMALVNRVGNPFEQKPCLQKWVNYVLSKETQTQLVSKQWMMPALKDVSVPPEFKAVPAVKKVARYTLSGEAVDALTERFGKEVQGEAW